MRRVKVWDGWIRFFHWSVVFLLAVSWVSIQTGNVEVHYVSGYAMLSLLLFRIAWGVAGSDTARFTRFLRSPLAGLRHLGRFRRREPDTFWRMLRHSVKVHVQLYREFPRLQEEYRRHLGELTSPDSWEKAFQGRLTDG